MNSLKLGPRSNKYSFGFMDESGLLHTPKEFNSIVDKKIDSALGTTAKLCMLF